MAVTPISGFLEANTASDFALASAIALIGAVIARVATNVYERRIKERLASSGSKAVEILPRIIDANLVMFLYLLSLYAGLKILNMPPKGDRIIDAVGLVALVFFAARFAVQLSVYALDNYRVAGGESAPTAFKGFAPLIKALIWILCAIFILDNMGFNVSTIVAGLGIGGVALALGAQTLLGDLFGYFVILFDRPFDVGDSIAVGDLEGTVTSVGIKTTRIRNLRGEEVVMPNTAMTSARLHNFTRMTRRRAFVKIGVSHDTPVDVLRQIPSAIEGVVRELGGVTFGRAHFAAFGDNALIFELVYHVESADYNVFMNRQEEVNFRLAEEFKTRGITFAHPPQAK
ncbi:MAG: mechanosensitive ion channel family protein [Nitrospinae bacterium]|nr:mechanosensitive ion channel family protein [Nitrospinota bacterium]